MRIFTSFEDVRRACGSPIGTSEWIEVLQQRIDQFASATDDRQWIHTDPERAAGGPYGTPIAHGYLTLSMLPALAATAYRFDMPGARINYGIDRVRFPAPVRVGSRIRSHSDLIDVQDLDTGLQMTIRTTVEIDGGHKPACVATTLTRLNR